MVKDIAKTPNESASDENVHEAIMRMLKCLSHNTQKHCRDCSDVDACVFVVEAVFACHCRDCPVKHVTKK